ncbi:MAG: hypothetical protein ABSE85_11020 [Candidatus Korobacteraceae bacterium]
MQSKEQSLSSLLRTISLAVIATLVMAVAMVPAWAQNSVPPTAVQAAKMPHFASRLAHPGQAVSPANASRAVRPPKLRASSRFTSQACSQKQARWLPEDRINYNNGPTNGNTDAWAIDFGALSTIPALNGVAYDLAISQQLSENGTRRSWHSRSAEKSLIAFSLVGVGADRLNEILH